MRLIAVVAAALALAAPAAAACTKYASQSRLETELVCPECHLTLDESNSPVAQEMDAEIARRIAQCQTNNQIKSAMVAEFGSAILSEPQTHGFDLIAWVLPLGGIALGAAGLAVGAWYWSRLRSDDDGPPVEGGLDPADEQRVDDALARFDG